MRDRSRQGWPRRLLEGAIIAAVYYGLCRLGQLGAIDPGHVTPVFPASGFALAVVWRRGYGACAAIWLGSLLGNAWAFFDPSNVAIAMRTLAVGAAIGVGAATQAAAGAFLMRRFCRTCDPFRRVGDVFAFLLVAAISCVVSPTVGVTASALGGVVSWSSYAYTWLIWYLGDAVGVVMVAPLLLAGHAITQMLRQTWRVVEAAVLGVFTIVVGLLIFTAYSPLRDENLPVAFLVAPPILWATLRFRQFGAALSVAVLSAIAIWGTATGYGPFVSGKLGSSTALSLLQIFTANTMASALLLSAALAAHRVVDDALRNSEERFRSVFERAPIGVAIAYPSGRFIDVNQGFSDIVGHDREELTEMTFADITEEEHLAESRALVGELLEGKRKAFSLEKRYRRKDRRNVWSNTVVTVVRYADGRPRFLLAMAVNITERKEAEAALRESEEKFRDLFENTRDLIQSVGPDGNFIYVNDAWKQTLGYDDDEVRRLNLFDVIHPDSHKHCRELFDRVVKGDPVNQITARFVTKDGRDILVEGSSSCKIENGRPIATRGIFHDVTERARAQHELARYAAELERSNEDLQQFAYVASHDLQEPLRAVAGFGQLLSKKYNDRLDEKGREYLEHIVDGARRMQTLLHDLLAYSRVQTRGQPFERVDCNAIVGEALVNLRARVEESTAEIQIADLPCVRADPTQLVQLFQNLIANAIKYSGERRPRVEVWAEAKGDEWTFHVRDNGIGIDPKHHERIFVIFQRLHTRDQYQGTGIGLAICKRIVERHRGKIWVESEPSVGTTFCFTLPISLLQEKPAPDAEAAAQW